MPFAKVDTAAGGTLAVVAGPAATQTIRVLSVALIAASAVTVQWKSGTTALSGAMSLITGTPLVLPPGPHLLVGRAAYMETNVGDALNLVFGGAVQVSGHIEYELRTT